MTINVLPVLRFILVNSTWFNLCWPKSVCRMDAFLDMTHKLHYQMVKSRSLETLYPIKGINWGNEFIIQQFNMCVHIV